VGCKDISNVALKKNMKRILKTPNLFLLRICLFLYFKNNFYVLMLKIIIKKIKNILKNLLL